MALFRYKAMTAAGAIVTGRIDAAGLADLDARLMRLGLDLIEGRGSMQYFRFGGGIPRRALINFCFHLEQLLSAGVPVIEGLIDLRDSIAHPQFRGVLAAMVENIEGGKRLSEAMNDHPRVFDPIVVSLVRAGEDSGKLPEILANLVVSLKWQDELAAKTRSLAIYPAVLAVATLGLLLFVMTYLVPRLSGFMRGMSRDLPWHTEALIAVSRFTMDNWYALLGIPLLIAGALVVAVRRDRRARLIWDSAKLRIPVFGNIVRKIVLARFASVFAVLYGAGISVLDAMHATESVAGNAAIARSLRQAGRSISAGETIAGAFDRAGLFPPLVIRMLRIGENTGALDRALSNVSYFFDRDVREAVERIQAMIEPAIIVAIGAIIGWTMLSVLGPIYDLIADLGV